MDKRILFVGGGTTGHISPLLAIMAAVEKEAKEQGITLDLHYVGLATDTESPLIKESGSSFTTHSINAGKLHRFITLDHVRQAGKLVKGMVEAHALVKRIQPDAVVAKGGAVSVPIVMAASRLQIPIFSHETDVIPGMANRFISRMATTIFTAYPAEYYESLPKRKTVAVGQPVRGIFYTPSNKSSILLDSRTLSFEAPLLVIIGGSQGAERLNQLVAEAWPELAKKAQLVHITGQRDYPTYTAKRLELSTELQEKLWVVPFIGDELAEIFKHSTTVISRAGGTIAELAATSCPTILVPLPTAAQNHQLANARVLEKAKAAVVLEEPGLTAAILTDVVAALLQDANRRAELGEHIHSFDRPNAAQVMAQSILKTIA